MPYLIAADTGGTFTDVVGVATDGSRLAFAKVLTTYDNPMRGVSTGFANAELDLRDAESIKFGTTLVINAFLQRIGAKTALLTTRGFRDTLEIRRGNRPLPFDLGYQRDPVLISREHRFEIDERIAADGSVITPLDGASLDEFAEVVRGAGYEALAISFLNSYANDAHERLAAATLRKTLPDLFITTGTEISREWYEYERSSTAAANAFVGPLLDHFLSSMSDTLAQGGFDRQCYIMASNGGVSSLAQARTQPVQLVESGPVGGCIGAAAYARALDIPKMIAFDMGGTTAKCALIEEGCFETQSPYYVGGTTYGFPIRSSVIDILEVGAGGGSIAHLDGYGNLQVGPRSAGSTPGPACYGLGGSEPTITDANVVLGRIGESSFLGGQMQLDAAAARDAVLRRIGRPLGYRDDALDQVAQGILRLGMVSMSGAISKISTERGHDPREFALFAFGGGGPVHGPALARELGIPLVIVPPHPGLFSCVGMLLADAVADEMRTLLRPLDKSLTGELHAIFDEVERSAVDRLPREALEHGTPQVNRFGSLRYRGQRHDMKIPLGAELEPEAIATAFHASYRARYGHSDPSAPIDVVAVGVSVNLPVYGVGLNVLTPDQPPGMPMPIATRDIYHGELDRRLPAAIYRRSDLPVGFSINGPIVIEEYGSSTILGPGDSLTVGRFGELHVRIAQ